MHLPSISWEDVGSNTTDLLGTQGCTSKHGGAAESQESPYLHFTPKGSLSRQVENPAVQSGHRAMRSAYSGR